VAVTATERNEAMTEKFDTEIDAIRTVLTTLQPLAPDVRLAVLEYVLKRLDLPLSRVLGSPPSSNSSIIERIDASLEAASPQTEKVIHLKELKEQKKPKSAIEMAVLVAYYLSHSVAPKDRKTSISTKDIETYFKIAGYKLPTAPAFTLPNAKNAGYLDSVGHGEYKLNPVGYNLVVHSLPRTK
jgi:hypothetical protein